MPLAMEWIRRYAFARSVRTDNVLRSMLDNLYIIKSEVYILNCRSEYEL